MEFFGGFIVVPIGLYGVAPVLMAMVAPTGMFLALARARIVFFFRGHGNCNTAGLRQSKTRPNNASRQDLSDTTLRHTPGSFSGKKRSITIGGGTGNETIVFLST